jgi:hypothetical protein
VKKELSLLNPFPSPSAGVRYSRISRRANGREKTSEPWELHNVGRSPNRPTNCTALCCSSILFFVRSQQFNGLHSLPIMPCISPRFLRFSTRLTTLNHISLLAFIHLTRSLQLPELCQPSVNNKNDAFFCAILKT